MQTFKHGDPVTLHDAYGKATDGILHFPIETQTLANGRVHRFERVETGSYSVHTLILPGGRKYRSEGRLYHHV